MSFRTFIPPPLIVRHSLLSSCQRDQPAPASLPLTLQIRSYRRRDTQPPNPPLHDSHPPLQDHQLHLRHLRVGQTGASQLPLASRDQGREGVALGAEVAEEGLPDRVFLLDGWERGRGCGCTYGCGYCYGAG